MEKKTKQSSKGDILIAQPSMQDPNFAKSVVLLLNVNDEGSMGLVLNRPTADPFNSLWKNVCEERDYTPYDGEAILHFGGPVFGPLCCLHTCQDAAEQEITPGLYFTANGEGVNKIVGSGKDFRAFVGYAGWGENQLQYELDAGAWFVVHACPGTKKIVFESKDTMYNDTYRQAFNTWNKQFWSRVGIKHIPDDPSAN